MITRDKEFKIQNNKRVAECYLCNKPITTDRKVRIGNKRSHLTCFAKTMVDIINRQQGWLKTYKYRLQRCRRYKDAMMLEEIAK